MVWASAVDAVPVTGVRTHRQELSPGVYLFMGTWDAAGVTKGTVDLTTEGVTLILGGEFHCLTGTGITLQGTNVDDAVASAPGKMAVIACTANDTGCWWAMCQMN